MHSPDDGASEAVDRLELGLVDVRGGMAFRAGGVLATPWGEGKWGIVRGSSDCAFAMFAGAVHVLTFHSGGIFVSRRCADGEEVLGRPEIVV